MRRLVRPLLVLLALSSAAACSDDDSATSETPGQTATTAAAGGTEGTQITIKDFAFTPADLRASAGDEILVRNTDGTVHTLTAENKAFDTGNIDANAEKTLTMSDEGTFSYRCNIHQSMKGTITVS